MKGDYRMSTTVLHNETFLSKTYFDIVSTICPVDRGLVEANLVSLKKGPDNEKILSLELANFMAEHFAYVISAAIIDYRNIRNTLGAAIAVEISLNEVTLSERLDYRNIMYTRKDVKTHCIEMGVTIFSKDIVESLYNVMNSEFMKMAENEDFVHERDSYLQKLTNDDVVALSVIFSNPIFLIKAFVFNTAFRDEIAGIVAAFKYDYKL